MTTESEAEYQRRIAGETIHELQRERDSWKLRAHDEFKVSSDLMLEVERLREFAEWAARLPLGASYDDVRNRAYLALGEAPESPDDNA